MRWAGLVRKAAARARVEVPASLAQSVFQSDIAGVVAIAQALLHNGCYDVASRTLSPQLVLAFATDGPAPRLALANDLPADLAQRDAWVQAFDALLNLPSLAAFAAPGAATSSAAAVTSYVAAHLSAVQQAREGLEVALEAVERRAKFADQLKGLYTRHRYVRPQ